MQPLFGVPVWVVRLEWVGFQPYFQRCSSSLEYAGCIVSNFSLYYVLWSWHSPVSMHTGLRIFSMSMWLAKHCRYVLFVSMTVTNMTIPFYRSTGPSPEGVDRRIHMPQMIVACKINSWRIWRFTSTSECRHSSSLYTCFSQKNHCARNATSSWATTTPIGIFKVSAIQNPPPVNYLAGRR